MPTTLPRKRYGATKHSRVRTVITALFNTFMLVSALLLTFLVLVREEQYALGRPITPKNVVHQTVGESPSGNIEHILPQR